MFKELVIISQIQLSTLTQVILILKFLGDFDDTDLGLEG
jgi:hypothetical protein